MTTKASIKNPADILEEMFPGDPIRGLPPFSALGREGYDKLDLQVRALAPYLRNHAENLAPLLEVNDVLAALRKVAYKTVQDFIFAALNVYFSAPAVVSILHEGRTILFPNVRTLPEIDYILLEPVIALTSNREPK